MHPTINIGIGIRIGRQDDDDDPSKLFGAESPWSVKVSQSSVRKRGGDRRQLQWVQVTDTSLTRCTGRNSELLICITQLSLNNASLVLN